MKHLYLLLLFAAVVVACDRHKKIEIWIENASARGRVVRFSSFLNDSLVDRREVGRDSVVGRMQTFVVSASSRLSSVSRLRFVADSSRGETGCTVDLDSIGTEAFVHVLYVERTVLAQGMMDSLVVHKGFGCRVYYH